MVEVEWRKMRADELRAKARDNAIVIVPIGSLEQHGPHCPVEVDSQLAEAVATATARYMSEREPVLVLPTVWTGLSEHHMSFGGTITLDFQAFSGLIEGICRSLVRLNFKRIVLFNGHGGNDNALRVITDELSPRLGIPILQFTYWDAAPEAIAGILDTQEGLMHACEAETSMMQAVRPELVDTSRIPHNLSNMTNLSQYSAPDIYRWRSIGSVSDSGILGNPQAATPEKGRRLIDEIARTIASKLTDAEIWKQPWFSETIST
jgi:creatinine amidohydrolase